MSRHPHSKGLVLGLALIVSALLVANLWSASSTSTKAVANTTGDSCTAIQVVQKLLKSRNISLDDVSINDIDPSLPGATSNRHGAFSNKPLLSESDLREFLASNDPGAVSARELLGDMQGVTWTPVQFKQAVHYDEVTIFVNGVATTVGPVEVPPGSVSWVATRGCDVVGIVRGGCGNHERELPTPVTTYENHHGCRHDCGSDHGCRHDCGGEEHKCKSKSLPDNRYEYDDSRHCSHHKKPTSFDNGQNHGPQHDPVQHNDPKKVKETEHKGDGNSSPSNGGHDSAPKGGDSNGNEGTHADTPKEDTHQGGDEHKADDNADAPQG